MPVPCLDSHKTYYGIYFGDVTLAIPDQRAAIALRGVKGKRLTYQTTGREAKTQGMAHEVGRRKIRRISRGHSRRLFLPKQSASRQAPRSETAKGRKNEGR